MTIDLGFAFLTDEITIIDVPGHEKFIRNMVAGVSTIDIALVTVAADDGVMPQTREHIDILRLLGVPLGCIAITKTDLVEDPDWLDLVEGDIRGYVKDSFLEDAPLLRVSSETGDGVEEVRSVLMKLASQASEKKDRGFFRLFVDRAFSMKGFGTVVTGTVVSGSLEEGDEVEILPPRLATKIRGIQSHGEDVPSVHLGDRAALNLANIDRSQVRRGSQLAWEGFIKPSRAVGAEIFLLPRTERVIRHEQRVRVHLGTDEVMGKVYLVTPDKKRVLSAGETAGALIKLEKVVPVAIDDPCVLRFYSPLETIGGGMIIDTGPPAGWKACKRWLKSLVGLSQQERLERFLESMANEPLTLKGWSARWQLAKPVMRKMLENLDITEFGSRESPFVTLESSLELQKRMCLEAVKRFHEQSPYRRGIPKDRLRQILNFSAPLFDYITGELEGEASIERGEGLIRILGFRVELTGEDRELASRLEKALKEAKYRPPTIKGLAELVDLPVDKTVQLMHILKGQGKAQEVSRDLWFHAETLTVMEDEIEKFFQDNSTMGVNDFKSLTNTTRKHAIPLLEYLDQRRVTRREGDRRILSR